MSAVIASAGAYLLFSSGDPGLTPYLVMAMALFMYPMTNYDSAKAYNNKLAFAVAGLAAAACCVLLFSFYNKKLVSAASALGMAGIILIFIGMKNNDNPQDNKAPSGALEIWAVSALTAAALFVRLFACDKIPLGYWFDEAQNGNEVLALLKNNVLEVFIPRYTQMPAMFMWLAAPFVKLLGPDIFSLRLVNVVLGTLCVPAFYMLLRYIFRNPWWAFFGAFLLAFSRWHIMFSRVAFLGMQTIFMQLLFFYFYIRMLREGRRLWGVIAGAVAGIMMYTFSAVNFVLMAALLHSALIALKAPAAFLKANFRNILASVLVFAVVSMPMLAYAAKNFGDYTRRMKDVSVMNDVEREKSLAPIIRNIKLHLLMFHYEGDYNGRHDLYKKPVTEPGSGWLLIIWLAAVAAGTLRRMPYAGSLSIIWFFCMLLPGIMTNTVEAPQAYRTSSVIPAMIMLCTAGAYGIAGLLRRAGRKPVHILLVFLAVAVSSSALSLREYFYVYPKDKSAYMDFSPEVSEISRLINSSSEDWFFFVSKAENMYGFYRMEQIMMLSFLSAPKNRFAYIEKEILLNPGIYGGKKGIAFITRPSDTELNLYLQSVFPGVIRQKYENPHTGDEMFGVYYIEESKIPENAKLSPKGVR